MNNSIFLVMFLASAISGCALPLHSPSPGGDHAAAAQALEQADSLSRSGKYADAIDAYRKVIQEHPAAARETSAAQFGIIMVLVAADNAQRDYGLALAKIDEFITQHPRHELIPQARSWRSIIKQLLDVRRENDRLNTSIERLKQLDMRQEEKRKGR